MVSSSASSSNTSFSLSGTARLGAASRCRGRRAFSQAQAWREHTFATVVFPVMIAASYVASRPNADYMVFIYPIFLLFILQTFEKLDLPRGLRWFAGSALLVLYCGHYVGNRSFDSSDGDHRDKKEGRISRRSACLSFISSAKTTSPIGSQITNRPSPTSKRIMTYRSPTHFGAYDRREVEIYHCRKKALGLKRPRPPGAC